MLFFAVAVGYLSFNSADIPQRCITAVLFAVVLASVCWEVNVHWSPGIDTLYEKYSPGDSGQSGEEKETECDSTPV